ncbi:histidine phosphatase superfamily [Coprinopsis sp. MPI-PUGE-AT-0042]|nr:histidine phosphatase superfamily [Coprinopsis sp. MPI-PUGE-AT-0042]
MSAVTLMRPKHNHQQAQAVGEFFKDTQFDHIYASDLHRAHDTGKAVHSRHAEPKPPFTITPLLREQHFGVAEGNPWVMQIDEGKTREEMYAENVYPVLWERHERFDDGESLNDLAVRANKAVTECVIPHVVKAAERDREAAQMHIAMASHGLAISEVVAALIRLDPLADKSKSYKGLLNTAWARVDIRIREGHSGPVDPDHLPALQVQVTHFNESKHLEAVSNIDIEVETESNEARAFFGSGGAEKPDPAVSATNARVDTGGESEQTANL